MASATLTRDALMPRQPPGMGIGLVLALLAHLVLVLALALGINWRSSQPAAVEAELWAAVPQAAAPREQSPPVQPAPAPVVKPTPPMPTPPAPAPVKADLPDPQIAIDKAKREAAKRAEDKRLQDQRLQDQKEAAERDAQRDEQAKKKLADKADAARLAALREANLKRMLGQAGATGEPGSTSTAQRSSGPSASYAGRIKARIKPNILFGDVVSGNPMATVEVHLAPDGTITSKRLITSSGLKNWDEAVLRAIERTEVLPRDTDGRVPPSFEIDFRPND